MSFNTDNYFRTSYGLILAFFPNDISIPQSLFDALLRIKEIKEMFDDNIIVEMYCENNPDFKQSIVFWAGFAGEKFWFEWDWTAEEEEMNSLKAYHNYKCIDYGYIGRELKEFCYLETADVVYALRFLTDYFTFLNPKVKTDDIQVRITLYP